MDKQTLSRYRFLEKLIEVREAEKKRLIESITTPKALDGMPHGTGVSDPTGNFGTQWGDLQMIIDQKLDEKIKLRIEIEESIACLSEADQLLILLHYIEGKTWEEVAQEMHYGLRHIHRLHSAILQKMALNGTTNTKNR